jgi:hypothetical protein
MADDRLELIASVKNLTSGPIRDIQRSMRALAADASGAHKLGTLQAKGHTEALYQLRREVGEVAGRVKQGLAPALSTLGISSLSAAAGLAAVAASVKSFADSARNLTFLSKQTELSVNQLRVLEQLAPRIGSSVEAMDESLRGFSEHMEKLRRAPLAVLRETFQQLNVRPDPQTVSSWKNLIDSLQGLSRAEQLGKVVGYLDKIRDMGQKRVVLQAFGLPKEFANLSGRELQEQIDRIKKLQTPLTPGEVAGGKAAADAISDIATSLGNLKDHLGASLAPDLEKVAEAIAGFSRAHADDIAKALHEFVGEMRALSGSEFVKGLREFASGLDEVVRATTGWTPILTAIAAYRIAQFTGLAAALRAIAGGMAAIAAVPPPAWLMPLLGALAAAKGAQEFVKDPGGAVGLTGPKSMGAHLRELYGMATGAKPDIQSERIMPPPGTGPGGAKPAEPLWKRLFHLGANEAPGGIQPAGFTVEGGGRNPLLGGAGDNRGAVRIIEEGTLAALRDFAAEQKGAEGGGGGAGGAMSAIRANYSGGGGGYGGVGAGTGEPAAGGGAGVGDTVSSPMGGLGSKPTGVESITRKFHPPSIPVGAGGMVADRLKAAGVNLPPHLDAKIRGGGQVTEGDLKALPPHILERANRAITGAGQPPLYSDAKPPHFGLGDIRKSLQGTAAAPSEAGQIDRSRFAKELEQNPALRDKVMRIAANEQGRHPQGTQSVMESMMNRAEVRGTDLEHQARWFRREKGGYYEMGNMGRGALENPGHRAVLERSLSNTLAGGNVSNYATDNSSGGLAARERASGKFKFQSAAHGETFFSPGWGEPGGSETTRNGARGSRLRGQCRTSARRSADLARRRN